MLPLLSLALFAPPVVTYPADTLAHEKLSLTVYRPDARSGFYRGTRFDWSGVITDLTVNGHKLFGPWLGKHDPTHNDSITGPCQEFGMDAPLGYADAKVGETFLKIGVGELVKPKEEKYRFSHNYKIAKPGEWTVTKDATGVTAEQRLRAANGYGYDYTKRVELVPGQAAFRLVCSFTNRSDAGKKIDTEMYNHNFFNVDADTIGPNYAIEFPFEPKALKPVERFEELVKLNRRMLTLGGLLDKGSIYAGLTGFDPLSPDYRFTMIHKPSGVKMAVRGTGPVVKFNLWGVGTCLCPEPFTQVSVAPGATVKWDVTYSFE